MLNIVDGIRQSLRDSVDEKTFSTGKNFFKEEIKLYGVKIPLVNKISKGAFDLVKDWKKKDICIYRNHEKIKTG